jgi:hypothetical protein
MTHMAPIAQGRTLFDINKLIILTGIEPPINLMIIVNIRKYIEIRNP